MKKILTITSIIAMGISLPYIAPALNAQENTVETQQAGTFGKFEVGLPGIPQDTTIDSFVSKDKPIVDFINLAVNAVIAILVIIGLISITVGGYLYMTAAGNGNQIGTAKEIIIASLIGIFLSLVSVVILNTVNRYLGEEAKEPTLGPTEGSALDSPSGAIQNFDDSFGSDSGSFENLDDSGSFGDPDNLPTF